MGKDYDIYNCHIHTFKKEDVPVGFLPFGLVKVISTKAGFGITRGILRLKDYVSRNRDSKYKKTVKFIKTGTLGSQEKIFLACSKQYPAGTKFIIHSIDMEFMNAGKVPRKYSEQLNELHELSSKYSGIVIPFIHLDPRRPDLQDLFSQYIIDKKFKGVKLYPPMGHIVDDERLTKIFEYCNEHKIPVLAHCGPQSPTHYRASKKTIRKMLDDANISYDKKMNEKELCAQFGHPQHYIPVLNKYPGMNICFGHWGSEISWKEYIENPQNKSNWFYIIKEMLRTHPNLYTDISFTLNDQEYFSVLKVYLSDKEILGKVLFGSDYYMVETKSTEKKFGFDLRAYLGEDFYKTIANENPVKYLN